MPPVSLMVCDERYLNSQVVVSLNGAVFAGWQWKELLRPGGWSAYALLFPRKGPFWGVFPVSSVAGVKTRQHLNADSSLLALGPQSGNSEPLLMFFSGCKLFTTVLETSVQKWLLLFRSPLPYAFFLLPDSTFSQTHWELTSWAQVLPNKVNGSWFFFLFPNVLKCNFMSLNCVECNLRTSCTF